MRLYIWDNVLTDYTDGIIIAMANSLDEARLAVLQEWDRTCNAPPRKSIRSPSGHEGSVDAAVMTEPKVYEVDRKDPVVRLVWGGA